MDEDPDRIPVAEVNALEMGFNKYRMLTDKKDQWELLVESGSEEENQQLQVKTEELSEDIDNDNNNDAASKKRKKRKGKGKVKVFKKFKIDKLNI